MPEYLRVVTFDADDAAMAALVKEIDSSGGPPPGVDATRITVLGDRAGGKMLVAVRFPSEEAMRAGDAVFQAMDGPPANENVRRTSVDFYEVLLDRSS
jgi:hypothetical protein